MTQKIPLEVLGLSKIGRASDSFYLVLGERRTDRRLPVAIGLFEAQAIAVRMEHIVPRRPLIHDLFFSLAASLDIRLIEVFIYDYHEQIFFTKLVCRQGDKQIEIESRTSDAVALALRFNAPIFTCERVMHNLAVVINASQPPAADQQMQLDQMPLSDLKKAMKEAIASEDYEQASHLRDAIRSREAE